MSIASLRAAFRGSFDGEDLRRAATRIVLGLRSGEEEPFAWNGLPRPEGRLTWALRLRGPDAELDEQVEIAGYIEDGRPEERGPVYGWKVVLRVIAGEDFVTVSATGGGHQFGGDSLILKVEVDRPTVLDAVRVAVGEALPELQDESDLADVVSHNVEAVLDRDPELARAWLARARADRGTKGYWPKIVALRARLGPA